MATLCSGFDSNGSMDAMVIGTKGEIRIPIFWKGSKAMLQFPFEEPQVYELPYESSGLQYQALHMMKMLDQGKLESPIMSQNSTLSVIQTMDTIREQWGLSYPLYGE